MTLEERFWAKVSIGGGDECWPWLGALSCGYGHIQEGGRGGKRLLVHRVSYSLAHGEIADGFTIDHLCHTTACAGGVECPHRRCVNPAHLAEATKGANSRRGSHPKFIAFAAGICLRGHPQTPETTRFRPDGRRHSCRVCLP